MVRAASVESARRDAWAEAGAAAPSAPAPRLAAEAGPSSGGPALVIGAGPCGMRAAEALARRGRDVVVLNAEPWDPYNRVKLTPLLAGDVQLGEVSTALGDAARNLTILNGVRATRIDLAARTVFADDGSEHAFGALVLATGSSAFVPQIPGRERPGVYTFRNADDVQALVARSFRARSVLVIGGGLLGLEAARGMHRRGASVTVVEHENRLMPRQLDAEAAGLLQDRIERLGVRVAAGARVVEILGPDGDDDAAPRRARGPVQGVRLEGAVDEILPVDTVIICAGVRADVSLAREAGLKTGRGVVVDDRMQASDPAVYAVGECAEHRGVVYGLVGPGLEQSDIAAAAIAGDPEAAYAGSTPATKLKVIGAEVFSIGDWENFEQQSEVRSRVWRDAENGLYRRVFIRRGKLAGALAVGDWPDASRAQAAALVGETVYPWMLWRFARDGTLWPDQGDAPPPRQAIICNCTGVTCGRIQDAITLGAASVAEISAATGASTVCGSCGPRIEGLLGTGAAAAPAPVKLHKPLLWISGIAALLALITLGAPRISLPDAYEAAPLFEKLWFDGIWKQWSGYSLLGLSLAAALIGARKRIGALRRLGDYAWWRVVHIAIGLLCLVGLFAHTGFRLGSGLNFWLMLSFCLTLLTGAVLGLATGGEHKLRAQGLAAESAPRTPSLWLHVLTFWPAPALLALHVLSVYAY